MTGYVRTCDGRRLTLPALLQWSVRLTDGDPCDSFSVRFLYEAELSEALRKAVLFEAEELGRTAFTGVVDDYEIRMDKKGLLLEMTGRGLAALLLDNQVRAAEYVRAQLEDILSTYVRPYGIVNIRAAAMPPVVSYKNVYGSYVHGIFDAPGVADCVLRALCAQRGVDFAALGAFNLRAYKERQYDLLAQTVRAGLDMKLVYRALRRE